MSATERAPQARPARVMLLDLLRLVAAFQMVQGHAIDAVLAPELRHGDVHAVWSGLRGLTSIAFLFVAGLSFHLATLRDLAGHRRERGAGARRFQRAGSLVLLGYALHLPLGALTADPQTSALAWQSVWAVDVLQCIGVSLGLLEALALLLPSRLAIELVCCALAALVLGLSPALARLDPSGPLAPLLHYLSARGGSLFPLFPWAAHVLLGAGLCRLLLGTAGSARRDLRLLAGALCTFACVALAARLDADLIAEHLRRLGCVLAAAALLSRLEPAASTWPAWTRRLAEETLFIYAFHVLLVYGQGIGLASSVGTRLSAPQAVVLAALVVALSATCALHYRRAFGGLARRTATG